MLQQGSEIIADYKKAYDELRPRVEACKKRLKEKENLLQEYEKRFPKVKELTRLNRVETTRTISYGIYPSGLFGQGAGTGPSREGWKKRYKILRFLAQAHPNGVSNVRLSKKIRRSRWTVSRWCKKLIQGGLVYQDKGKFGKYHLTQLILGGQSLQGYWLERIVYDSFISKYTSPNSTIKEKVFALVVTLGIYSTYVIIQAALDEDFHSFIGAKVPDIEKIRNFLKSSQKAQNGNQVRTQIEGAIHPLQMFLQLCRLVVPHYGSTATTTTIGPLHTFDTPTTPSEDIPSRLFFERNSILFKRIRKAFEDLYPEDFQQLEGIRKEQAPITAWSQLKKTYRNKRHRKEARH